jgi:hypothetical protein
MVSAYVFWNIVWSLIAMWALLAFASIPSLITSWMWASAELKESWARNKEGRDINRRFKAIQTESEKHDHETIR